MSKWISIKKCAPGDGRNVLIYTNDHKIKFANRSSAVAWKHKAVWHVANDFGEERLSDNDITHWRHLPKPPVVED